MVAGRRDPADGTPFAAPGATGGASRRGSARYWPETVGCVVSIVTGKARVKRPHLLYAAAVAAAVTAGVVVHWPVRQGGMYTDDYVHHAVLDRATVVERSPLDLYTLIGGDEEETCILRDFGSISWWCHPQVQLAMLRPLSSALIAFDHYLLDKNTLAFHAHSLLWWVFMVISVGLLLRELFPLGVAAIAVVLFAVEEGNGIPVFWIANRCALVSLSFGFLGLRSHIRWRRGGGRLHLGASIALFILAMLGGEWAFTVFAYLGAYELLGSRDRLAVRARALAAPAAIGVCFLLAARLLDYRTRFSNTYISPFEDPLYFLANCFPRAAALVAEIVFGIPADWWHAGSPWRGYFLSLDLFSRYVWTQLPDWRFWHALIGVAGAVLAFFILRWALRLRRDPAYRDLGWLLAGSLLALLPMVAPYISARSVLPAFVGVSAGFAIILWESGRVVLSFRRQPLHASLIAPVVIAAIIVSQLVLPCRRSWREAKGFFFINNVIERWVLEAEIERRTESEKRVVLVNGLEGHSAMFAPYVRHFHGHPMPRSWWVLSGAPRAHDIVRTAPNVLEMTVLGGRLLDSDFENICRSDLHPIKLNETVKLEGLQVTVVALLDGKPLRVRYTFDRNLEDPSYVFLHSTYRGLIRFPVPPVGERIRLVKGQLPDPALFPEP